ncbi:response regulator transcription factor [Enterococcus canis]|nr:response regulator transcription factor [Enterococcus canis]
MTKILLIEDDHVLSDSIKDVLKSLGEVSQQFDGEEGLFEASSGLYDLIVLDLMLPTLRGEEVLKQLRQQEIYTPVLILTAKDSFDDKLNGFRNGADDYVTKPFHREELLVRSQALLRRSLGYTVENQLTIGALVAQPEQHIITFQQQEIPLQGKEFDLLLYLMQNAQHILTKDQLFDRIWGFQSDTTLTVVEVYMSNLRKRLKPFGIDKWITTIRNVGYLFKSEVTND